MEKSESEETKTLKEAERKEVFDISGDQLLQSLRLVYKISQDGIYWQKTGDTHKPC